eukprot:11218280-Lingulodinium_polyedra.AAC.1
MPRLSPEQRAGPIGQASCRRALRAARAAQASAARAMAPRGRAWARASTRRHSSCNSNRHPNSSASAGGAVE